MPCLYHGSRSACKMLAFFFQTWISLTVEVFSPQFMAMFRIINMDKPSNLTFFSPECSHILSHICWFQTTAGHWHSSCLAKVQPSASLLEATEFGRGLCHKLRPWTAPFLIGSHWRSNTKIPVDTSCTLHTKVL